MSLHHVDNTFVQVICQLEHLLGIDVTCKLAYSLLRLSCGNLQCACEH